MMKRVLTSLLTALLLAGPVTTALAQDYVPTPVTISKDKVKFKGKTYYSHVVLERQTLYSIAQAYGVTVQEIYDANPDLTVLKKNAIILIPDTSAKGYQKPVEAEPAPAVPEPEKKAETPSEQLPESGYTEYIVKWNDTLYSIAEKFGVTVESIQKANGLTDTKIKKRQVLRIPTPETFAAQQAAAAATAPAETPHREEEPQLTVILPAEASVETADTASTVSLWQENFYDRTGYVRTEIPFALVLPFQKGTKVSDNNVDFYSGVLMAVREMSLREGINADLRVYDMEELSSASQLRGVDFILGPVSREAVSKVLGLRPDSDIPVVSPLDPKVSSLLSSAEDLIQVPASNDMQYADLIQWLQEDYSVGEKILLISEKEAAATDYSTRISARLAHSGLPYKVFSYGILQGRNITGSLTEMLSKERTNRILIASENEAFVNDVIRNLNVLTHKDYPIEVYGPAKFRSFETIEVEAFHSVRLHVSSAYHIDYTDEEVHRFLMEYRAFCQTEPGPYAFQGYDIASYLLRRIARYGDAWKESLLQIPETMTQLRFDFKRSRNDSYENNGTRRVIYDKDFTIRTVR